MQKQTVIPQGPNNDQVRTRWNGMAPVYITMDSAPQTFFYTLSNMLKLNQAKNVLQIACGAGKLIPQVLDLKSPETFYYATDLSQEMIKFAKLRLQSHFQKYQSKLSFDEWVKKQNLQFAVLNGQQPIPGDRKFDRIICNLVLMLTSDAKRMLKNLWQSAQDSCLLGLTVWGDKAKNNFFGFVQDFNKQHNLLPPNGRSNFFLYNLVEDLVEECGWEKVIAWQQNGMFPIIQHSQTNIHPFLSGQVLKNIPVELHPKFHAKLHEIFNEKKQGMTFSCKLMIVRKISQK